MEYLQEPKVPNQIIISNSFKLNQYYTETGLTYIFWKRGHLIY